jgi:hypothetical protein
MCSYNASIFYRNVNSNIENKRVIEGLHQGDSIFGICRSHEVLRTGNRIFRQNYNFPAPASFPGPDADFATSMI